MLVDREKMEVDNADDAIRHARHASCLSAPLARPHLAFEDLLCALVEDKNELSLP